MAKSKWIPWTSNRTGFAYTEARRGRGSHEIAIDMVSRFHGMKLGDATGIAERAVRSWEREKILVTAAARRLTGNIPGMLGDADTTVGYQVTITLVPTVGPSAGLPYTTTVNLDRISGSIFRILSEARSEAIADLRGRALDSGSPTLQAMIEAIDAAGPVPQYQTHFKSIEPMRGSRPE